VRKLEKIPAGEQVGGGGAGGGAGAVSRSANSPIPVLQIEIMFNNMERKKAESRWFATALLFSALTVAAEYPTPIATLDLNGPWPGAVATSLAFASEDTIALARYPGSDTVSRVIISIDWRDAKLQLLKSKSLPLYGGEGFEDV
jgi:hypothetical protein